MTGNNRIRKSKRLSNSSASARKQKKLAVKRLENAALLKLSRQSRRQKQDFERKIRKLRTEQKKKIEIISARRRSEAKSWQKRLKSQARKSKESFEREFIRLKKNYQMNAEHLRDVYDRQNSLLRNSFDRNGEARRRDFEGMASANRSQLEKLQKWLQDELVHQLLEKKHNLERSEAEQIKMSAELKMSKMAEQLSERNSEVEMFRGQVQQLEGKIATHYAHALSGKMGGGAASDPDERQVSDSERQRQELLGIIKEIAQKKVEMNKEREAPAAGEDPMSMVGSWTSKMAKAFR